MVTKSEGGVVEIVGAVQNYDWGIVGSNSTVAKLDASNAERPVDEGRPYAEVSRQGPLAPPPQRPLTTGWQLWMGTHPNAPAVLKGSGRPLKEHLGKGKKDRCPIMASQL